MKKKLLIASSIATLIILGLVLQTNSKSTNEIDSLREKHISFLDNSPFKETQQLSKADRKAQGLPPNSYNEMMWDLTMDPATGKPEKERLFALQESLTEQFNRVPGENTNSWEERGPDNVGGRTRAIMYDPNDGANGYKRVFAGGVSGGLWVIDDITNAASTWTEVGIPQNLAITCITYDPNDTDVFYVGTGESYVGGDVNGNGVWKSTDGGASWSHVFGGTTGATVFQADAVVTINSPGNIAGDVPAILATAFGGQLGSPITGDLVLVDDGTGNTDDGCEALTNGAAINGNIAVIRRGDCNFDDKIKNAQDAGAIAVIMVNNIAGLPISMGGDDLTITIPSVMITRDEGNAIIAELGGGVNATIELSGASFSGTNVPGVHHINDIKVRDAGEGASEVYVAASSTVYADANPRNWFGIEDFGLYKSTDDGANWGKMDLGLTTEGTTFEPNDIEISIDGTIWIGTEVNPFGHGGGTVLTSTDGTTFTKAWSRVLATVEIGRRTQIAVSGTDANVIYVLMTQSTGSALYMAKTNNAFTNRITFVAQPQDVDTATRLVDDFTGGQGFYDLLLEVDPTDDTVVYVGGIDLFRSDESGASEGGWEQISKWSNNNNLGALGVSLVHADHHALTFNPTDSNLGVFGNDGGVYYSNTLSGAGSSTSAISARNNNYNTLQFYKGAIGQEVGSEKLLAGAQDNGSQLINNASPGIGGSNRVTGGDGAYVFIDKDNEYMISSYVFNTYYYLNYATGGFTYNISGDQSNGAFINPAALDSDNNILYADGTTGTPAYQIFRYTLGGASATRATLTNGELTRSVTALKASTFTTTTLFAGQNDGKLLKLLNADASPTWSDITGPDFVGSISCIELGATENDIFVTFYNYGVKSIYYSADGGASWASKEGNLPDIPVRAVLQNPLNAEEVIVGTDLGVWATKDFSSADPTWYQSQNGMKDVVVTSFDLRTADNTVLASTYGRGMFTGTFDATTSGLSVDDFTQNNLIKIYPTVSNGEITIAPTSEVRAGALNIFDVNGREVHASNLDFATSATQRLSLNLSSGVYIVKFTANDVQSTQKIIIE